MVVWSTRSHLKLKNFIFKSPTNRSAFNKLRLVCVDSSQIYESAGVYYCMNSSVHTYRIKIHSFSFINFFYTWFYNSVINYFFLRFIIENKYIKVRSLKAMIVLLDENSHFQLHQVNLTFEELWYFNVSYFFLKCYHNFYWQNHDWFHSQDSYIEGKCYEKWSKFKNLNLSTHNFLMRYTNKNKYNITFILYYKIYKFAPNTYFLLIYIYEKIFILW